MKTWLICANVFWSLFVFSEWLRGFTLHSVIPGALSRDTGNKALACVGGRVLKSHFRVCWHSTPAPHVSHYRIPDSSVPCVYIALVNGDIKRWCCFCIAVWDVVFTESGLGPWVISTLFTECRCRHSLLSHVRLNAAECSPEATVQESFTEFAVEHTGRFSL